MRYLVVLTALFLAVGCSDTEEKGDPTVGQSCDGSDSCADMQTCSTGSKSEYRCLADCSEDADCESGQECVRDDEAFRVCDDPRPVCDGDAAEADCDCGFKPGVAFVVSGTGADCAIVERDTDACFGQWSTCLNACVDEFYRYDLGDGTALIVRGLQGGITEGWTSDGQGGFPMSCPALDGEFAPSNI